MLAWLSDSDRWRAVCTVVARDGRGHFLVRTLQGERPEELDRGTDAGDGRTLFPFSAENADARQAARRPAARRPRRRVRALAPARRDAAGRRDDASSSARTASRTSPSSTSGTARRRRRSASCRRRTRCTGRAASSCATRRGAWRCRPTPRSRRSSPSSSSAHPEVHVEEPARELLEELTAEYERASETVALSYADDAELDGLELGGELHPFQRAGVRYALDRRRTFIADEQGLGKTVQALATIEGDDAFPTVVVCPASMKLVWEREAKHWLPNRTRRRARRPHRTRRGPRRPRRPRSSSSTTTSSTGTPTGWPSSSRAR